jgi:lipopolysaccharide export system ATP-binding protein
MTETTLSGRNLFKQYGKRTVVSDASIEVKTGEVVGLLGPNGAGKTTTFYMVTGMIRPNSGAVFLGDEDITRSAMYKRARAGIGYLPQEASIFRKLSVEDNLRLVCETLDIDKQSQEEKLEHLLDELSISHVRKNIGHQLSGGERRRTEIARALVTDPKFILLDEPFAGVDPIAVEDIQQIVLALKNKGIGVLITDHNVHETLYITDRSYLLFQGKILLSGNAEFLANDEQARKLYLGSNFKLDR